MAKLPSLDLHSPTVQECCVIPCHPSLLLFMLRCFGPDCQNAPQMPFSTGNCAGLFFFFFNRELRAHLDQRAILVLMDPREER